MVISSMVNLFKVISFMVMKFILFFDQNYEYLNLNKRYFIDLIIYYFKMSQETNYVIFVDGIRNSKQVLHYNFLYNKHSGVQFRCT